MQFLSRHVPRRDESAVQRDYAIPTSLGLFLLPMCWDEVIWGRSSSGLGFNQLDWQNVAWQVDRRNNQTSRRCPMFNIAIRRYNMPLPFFFAFNDHVLIGATEQKKMSSRSGCRFHQLVVSEQTLELVTSFIYSSKKLLEMGGCALGKSNKQIKVKTIMGQVCRGGFRSRLQHCNMPSCTRRTGSLIFALMGCWVINHAEERKQWNGR